MNEIKDLHGAYTMHTESTMEDKNMDFTEDGRI